MLAGHNRMLWRVVDVDDDDPEVVWAIDPVNGSEQAILLTDARPDLTDPATLGCLLWLVREHWEIPDACISYDEDGWHVFSYLDNRLTAYFETEAEALVAALESAP
jgi:hypothetical protein